MLALLEARPKLRFARRAAEQGGLARVGSGDLAARRHQGAWRSPSHLRPRLLAVCADFFGWYWRYTGALLPLQWNCMASQCLEGNLTGGQGGQRWVRQPPGPPWPCCLPAGSAAGHMMRAAPVAAPGQLPTCMSPSLPCLPLLCLQWAAWRHASCISHGTNPSTVRSQAPPATTCCAACRSCGGGRRGSRRRRERRQAGAADHAAWPHWWCRLFATCLAPKLPTGSISRSLLF